jgi:hypothetical protein
MLGHYNDVLRRVNSAWKFEVRDARSDVPVVT